MKFTKEYIEMVSKAKEIQGLWKQKVGDWVVDYNYMIPMLLDKKIEGLNKPIIVIGWLPTLENLFGMLDLEPFAYVFGDLDNWAGYYFDRGKLQPEELKEKVLEYVMNLNYGKDWNPEKKEWEEINGS
jgi:hypothetical protein